MLEGMVPNLKRALLVVLVLGAFFVSAQFVIAQGTIFDDPLSPTGPANGPFPTTPSSGGGTSPTNPYGDPANYPPGGLDGTGENIESTPVVTVTDAPSCWSSPQGFFHCIMVSFFGSFVAIAGYALDWSIQLFITEFGQMYLDYGVGAVVEGTWGTVRDIFNLTFIFGLVYIGFQIILGVNESSAKRTIPMLIVAALLVNFSLFIVKFIVDFANLAALQIYNLFSVASSSQASPGNVVDILTGGEASISLAFINAVGVTSLLSHNPSAGSADGVPLFYTFGMIIVFLVLIWVFFAAAILITIRFAALTFYMIFSPIMFLGWVFPGMKSYSDKFWQGLFGQAFFAPALLFMLYITYQLSSGLAGPNRVDGTVFQDEANLMGFAQFVPYLVLIVVFLMASLIVAKKMANQGASMVGKVNDWAVGKAGLMAGGMTAGLMARAGRNTVGAGANAMQNSEWGKNLAARGGRFGKMVYGGVGKVADSSMDARKIGGVGKKMGVGEGRKGGMTTILKEEKESDEKFMKALGTREWTKGKFEDSADAIKLQTSITALASGVDGVTDPAQKAHMTQMLADKKTEFTVLKKQWDAEESKYIYGRQLNYISALESWQSKQKYLGAGLALGAGVIATGGLGLAAGAVAGTAAGATSAGYWYNTKKAAGTIRKEYGKDGTKKKKKDTEEKRLKEALARAGYKEPEEHGDKGKGHDNKEGGNHVPPKPAATSAPKPVASGGGGGGQDNHGSGGHH